MATVLRMHTCITGASYQAFSKKFEEGTMVKVGVEVEQFEKMQEGHGGWEDDMSQVRTQRMFHCK